jgi:hypothetical protein
VQIGTGNAGPPGSEELEIDVDMSTMDLRLKRSTLCRMMTLLRLWGRLTNLPWGLSVLANLAKLEPKILKPKPGTINRLTNLPWDLSVLTNLKELDLSMNLYTQMPDQAHILQSIHAVILCRKCPRALTYEALFQLM